jgi:serine/threonine protein kinase
MSPEQLKTSCNAACDVWACGCVFFDLVCGCSLVPAACWEEEAKAHEFMFSHAFGDMLRLFDGKCGHVVGGDTESALEARDLLRGLLHRAWKNRLTATDALRNGFLKRCRCCVVNDVSSLCTDGENCDGACESAEVEGEDRKSRWRRYRHLYTKKTHH